MSGHPVTELPLPNLNTLEALLVKIQAEREALALEKKAAKKSRNKKVGG
jgi:hypothetical protein